MDKEKRNKILWGLFIAVMCTATILIADYNEGTGMFHRQSCAAEINDGEAGYTCYSHNKTFIPMGAKDSMMCDNETTCVGYIENCCTALFIIINSDGNETTIDMEPMMRYMCWKSQTCYMFTETGCTGMLAVFDTCVLSYAEVGNKTLWCNGTVEYCEESYRRRK